MNTKLTFKDFETLVGESEPSEILVNGMFVEDATEQEETLGFILRIEFIYNLLYRAIKEEPHHVVNAINVDAHNDEHSVILDEEEIFFEVSVGLNKFLKWVLGHDEGNNKRVDDYKSIKVKTNK